jgi:arylsulfatase
MVNSGSFSKGVMMATDKPNVLLIADDVGWFDVGAYHRGIMGCRTPNIDRIAAEGALPTDAAGRRAASGEPAGRERLHG